VIDYVSHTGEMLNRTGADVGSDVVLFDAADIFVFCSATLSDVTIGYRNYPQGEMQKVQALLDEITKDAIGE